MSKTKSAKIVEVGQRNKQSAKESPSTASPSTPQIFPQDRPFQLSENLWTRTSNSLAKTRNIKLSLNGIEESYAQTRQKFDKIIEYLILQVQKNNEQNRKLAEDIQSLKGEVKQCAEDIKMIQSMTTCPLIINYRKHQQSQSRSERPDSRNSSKSKSRKLLRNKKSSDIAKSKGNGSTFPYNLSIKLDLYCK